MKKMKWPTMDEFAQMVADKALDEVEYNGKTIRQWVEIISEYQLGTNLAEVGTDCISRQAAIDTIEDFPHGDVWNVESMEEMVDRIKQLPPIQPKRGRWILDRSGAYCCSECMEPCATYVMMKPRDKYCKMCGAKMEVTE